jgi:hypothetical protein
MGQSGISRIAPKLIIKNIFRIVKKNKNWMSVVVFVCTTFITANCSFTKDLSRWRGINRDAKVTRFTAPKSRLCIKLYSVMYIPMQLQQVIAFLLKIVVW